jgi:hypothetical protein
MKENNCVRLLAYVTGLVDQECCCRTSIWRRRTASCEFICQLDCGSPIREVTLAEIGKRLGRKALKEVPRVAKPDTILAWYRRLIAEKLDGSKHRSYPGRA